MSSTVPATGKKQKSRLIPYFFVLLLIGAVVAAAYFQEQIGYFFSMRLWDRGAPGRVVTQFLTAMQKGDQGLADSYLGNKQYKPLMRDGKWVGYSIATQAGNMEFTAEEIVPQNIPSAPETEFVYLGPGAAVVSVPNAQGKPEKYRLEMQGGWKITEMLGGRPVASGGMGGAPPSGPPGGGPPGGGAPGRPTSAGSPPANPK